MAPKAEETFGKRTPWDSVYKLEHLARKAGRQQSVGTAARSLWLIDLVNDLCYNRMVAAGELSVANLTGKGRGGKGLLDLLLFKRDVLEHLLQEKMEVLGLPASAKSAIREHMSSVAAYRAAFGHRDAAPADLTWFGALPQAAQHLIRLIEAGLLNGLPAHVFRISRIASVCALQTPAPAVACVQREARWDAQMLGEERPHCRGGLGRGGHPGGD